MKEKLILLRDTIDAKTLRERLALFAVIAGLIVYLVVTVMLSPLFAQQALLHAQINQQTNNMIGIDGEITSTILAFQRDPDQVARMRLMAARGETAALRVTMLSKQANLVSPEDMVPLLENLLRANTRLRLMALNSVAAQPVRSAAASGADSASTAGVAGDAIYRHGVELSVSGNYLDMVAYMRALESMPTRLFWGRALLQVEEYPTSRLTLTLYTLSLDKKWMTL